MRIVQACPYAWDAPGGVQVHVGELARTLRERGHEVLVLAPGRTEPTEPGLRIVGRPVRVPYNGSVAPICPTPRSARRVQEAIEAFEPDIVHVHEPFAPSTSMFAARRSPVPVVATFHAYADRALALTAAAPLLKKVWRRLAAKVAVSGAAASFVERTFGDGIRIIPNGVDIEAFAHAEPASGLPDGRRILFVNRLDRRKGFPVAIRAFGILAREFPDLVLVVAGDGPDRTAVRHLPPETRTRVAMLGRVPHDRLPAYHAACEAFVGPATGRESFGIVLVEAMAAGKPLVASDIPGYREVVRDGVEGILVSPGDAGRLAEGVRRVLTDPTLAESFAEAGRRRSAEFSWDRVASQLEAVYEDALRGR